MPDTAEGSEVPVRFRLSGMESAVRAASSVENVEMCLGGVGRGMELRPKVGSPVQPSLGSTRPQGVPQRWRINDPKAILPLGARRRRPVV